MGVGSQVDKAGMIRRILIPPVRSPLTRPSFLSLTLQVAQLPSQCKNRGSEIVVSHYASEII